MCLNRTGEFAREREWLFRDPRHRGDLVAPGDLNGSSGGARVVGQWAHGCVAPGVAGGPPESGVRPGNRFRMVAKDAGVVLSLGARRADAG